MYFFLRGALPRQCTILLQPLRKTRFKSGDLQESYPPSIKSAHSKIIPSPATQIEIVTIVVQFGDILAFKAGFGNGIITQGF
jgi:hypothetical protein